jgi:DNA repair exonuclease SbcCD ATPase subunit
LRTSQEEAARRGNAEITRLQQELERSRRELEASSRETELLAAQQHAREFEQKVTGLQQELDRARSGLTEAREEAESRQAAERQRWEQERLAAQQQSEQEREAIRHDFTQVCLDRDTLQQRLDALEQERTQTVSAADDLRDARADVGRLTDELNAARQGQQAAADRQRNLEQQIDAGRALLAQQEEESRSKIDGLETDLRAAREALEQVALVDPMAETVQAPDPEVAQLRQELIASYQQQESAAEQQRELTQQIDSLHAELTEERNLAEQQQNKIASLEEELESARTVAEQAESIDPLAEAEPLPAARGWKSWFGRGRSDKPAVAGTPAPDRESDDVLARRNKELVEQIQALRAESDQSRHRDAEHERHVAGLRSEIEQAKATTAQVEAERDRLQEQASQVRESVQGEVEQFRQEAESLRQALRNMGIHV